jgi:hypothetical protein
MPPIDSMWRLTADVPLRAGMLGGYHNEELRTNLGASARTADWSEYETVPGKPYAVSGFWDAPGRRDRFKAWEAEQFKGLVLAKGTVLRFERYHVSRSGEEQITLMILVSPDQRINPKKMGGKAKGKGRVYLWVEDFNNLGELEPVDVLD